RELIPHVREWEEKGEVPRSFYRKMASLGFLGAPVPEKYGGAGMDYVSFMLLVEEISRGSSSVRTTVSVQTSLSETSLMWFGSESQKEKWLVPLAKGERFGAWAITEPEAGSDAGNLATTAKLEGNEWMLNGQKRFISNGSIADYVQVYAREPGRKATRESRSSSCRRTRPVSRSLTSRRRRNSACGRAPPRTSPSRIAAFRRRT